MPRSCSPSPTGTRASMVRGDGGSQAVPIDPGRRSLLDQGHRAAATVDQVSATGNPSRWPLSQRPHEKRGEATSHTPRNSELELRHVSDTRRVSSRKTPDNTSRRSSPGDRSTRTDNRKRRPPARDFVAVADDGSSARAIIAAPYRKSPGVAGATADWSGGTLRYMPTANSPSQGSAN